MFKNLFLKQKVHCDFSWINQEFVESSKAIFGSSRSGKTRFMASLAREYLVHNPEGEIRIIDPFFIDRPEGLTEDNLEGLTDDDSLWLLGLPDKLVKDSYVISYQGDSQGKYKGSEGFVNRVIGLYERMASLLEYRKANGIKFKSRKWEESKEQRFYLFNDEFLATLKVVKAFNKKAAERITQFIIPTVAFEGAKYGVNFTLGSSPIDKSQLAIDSDALLSHLNLVYLGNSLVDPNTPVTIEAAHQRLEISRNVQDWQRIVYPETGYACAVRLKNHSLYLKVKTIPHIKLKDLWISFSAQ